MRHNNKIIIVRVFKVLYCSVFIAQLNNLLGRAVSQVSPSQLVISHHVQVFAGSRFDHTAYRMRPPGEDGYVVLPVPYVGILSHTVGPYTNASGSKVHK